MVVINRENYPKDMFTKQKPTVNAAAHPQNDTKNSDPLSFMEQASTFTPIQSDLDAEAEKNEPKLTFFQVGLTNTEINVDTGTPCGKICTNDDNQKIRNERDMTTAHNNQSTRVDDALMGLGVQDPELEKNQGKAQKASDSDSGMALHNGIELRHDDSPFS